MTTIRTLTVLALGAVSLAAFGCEQRRDEPPVRPADMTRPTDKSLPERADREKDIAADRADKKVDANADEKTTANNPSIKAIAMARCDREATCENIGADKKFSTRDACMTDLLEDLNDELKMSECPGGIVQKELDECLAEIKNENCKNPIDKLERLAACRTSDMCKAIN